MNETFIIKAINEHKINAYDFVGTVIAEQEVSDFPNDSVIEDFKQKHIADRYEVVKCYR